MHTEKGDSVTAVTTVTGVPLQQLPAERDDLPAFEDFDAYFGGPYKRLNCPRRKVSPTRYAVCHLVRISTGMGSSAVESLGRLLLLACSLRGREVFGADPAVKGRFAVDRLGWKY